MRRLLILAALMSACSSSTSTAPSTTTTPPVTTTPAPATSPTFSGTLSATNGGQPLVGVTVSSGGTTDSSGRFTAPASTGNITFSGPSILTRVVNLQAPGHAFGVDAIALSGGFDLNFYRALARDGFDLPNNLQPVRRWLSAPNIYIRTIDDAGRTIDDATLNTTASALNEVAAAWTGGRFGIASMTRGTETREGVTGWITVKWNGASSNVCGLAQVGTNGGYIQLDRFTPRCQCAAGQTAALVRPATVKHELGHALGFWHTGNQLDLMGGFGDARCNIDPDERERYHAAIMYSRPIGNVDPDADPVGVNQLSSSDTRLIVD